MIIRKLPRHRVQVGARSGLPALASSLAVLLAVSLTPAAATAQFGALRGAVQRRIDQAAEKKNPADSARAAAPGSSTVASDASRETVARPRSTNVLTLTSDVIDRTLRGVAAERSHERDRQTAIATTTGGGGMNVYFACLNDFDNSPEGKQYHDRELAALRNHDGKAARAAADSATQRAKAAKCGTPEQAAARGTASDQAQRNAHEAALHDTTAVGASVAGMTPAQFGVARERLTAFALLGGSKGACMQRTLHYIFTDEESAALTARRADILAAFGDDVDTRRALAGYCTKA